MARLEPNTQQALEALLSDAIAAAQVPLDADGSPNPDGVFEAAPQILAFLIDALAKSRAELDRAPAELDRAIRSNVVDAVARFAQEPAKGAEAPKVTVDEKFVKDQGGALLGELLKGFVRALVPPNLEVELKSPDGSTRPVKVDLSKFVDSLAPKGPAAPKPPSEPTAE